MSDLSLEYPGIVKMVGERHAAFLGKFGDTIVMLGGEHVIATTRIRAKLDLLSKAFLQSGVIDSVEYGVVSSRDGVFPMSLAVSRKAYPTCLYLLNTGKDVIISDSVGLAQSMNTLDARIVLVTDTKRICKRFSGVLDPSFDWLKMSEFILDAIHEVLYDSEDARHLKMLEKFTT